MHTSGRFTQVLKPFLCLPSLIFFFSLNIWVKLKKKIRKRRANHPFSYKTISNRFLCVYYIKRLEDQFNRFSQAKNISQIRFGPIFIHLIYSYVRI